MAYVYIPITQKELDDFRTVVWNNNRGRKQVHKALPNGKPPTVVYKFPEECCGSYTDFGLTVDDTDFFELGLIEELAPIFEGKYDDFIPSSLRTVLDNLLED